MSLWRGDALELGSGETGLSWNTVHHGSRTRSPQADVLSPQRMRPVVGPFLGHCQLKLFLMSAQQFFNGKNESRPRHRRDEGFGTLWQRKISVFAQRRLFCRFLRPSCAANLLPWNLDGNATGLLQQSTFFNSSHWVTTWIIPLKKAEINSKNHLPKNQRSHWSARLLTFDVWVSAAPPF